MKTKNLLLLLAMLLSNTGVLAATVTGSKPLSTMSSSSVKPNIMFTMDDSGSMDSSHMPDSVSSWRTRVGYRNSSCNGVYYNPNTTYLAPKNADGSSFADASFTAAKYNGFKSTETSSEFGGSSHNLSTLFFPYDNNTGGASGAIREPAYYDQFISGTPTNTDCNTTHNGIPIQVRIASTANIATLSGLLTIDGVTLVANDMVLVKNQTTSKNNGIYTVKSGAWTRHTAYDTAAELQANSGVKVYVLSGTSNVNKQYQISPTSSIILGTTNLSFPLLSGSSLSKWTKVLIPTDASAPSVALQKNFANWFSFYRTRMLMMKSSTGLAFSDIDSSFRIGFSNINSLLNKNYTSTKFLNIDDFTDVTTGHKTKWYTMLYGIVPGPATPLVSALDAIGKLYKTGALPSGGTGTVIDPMQYSCQLNFEILTTDGYWNQTLPSPALANQDGTPTPRPQFDGAGQPNNLADYAMYYYKTDLRTSGALSTNNAPGIADYEPGRQMMHTYTIGLGVNGTLPFVSDYETNTNATLNAFVGLKDGSRNWPTILNNNLTGVDDLWHAAVNGGGKYFSAKDPNAVADSLQSALGDITSKSGAGGAADAASEFVTTVDNYVFFANYKTREWTGDVIARTINVDTAAFNPGNLWSAQTLLDARDYSTRVIKTCLTASTSVSTCTSFTDFTAASPAIVSMVTPGLSLISTANTLNTAQVTANNATNFINFLRGQKTNYIKVSSLSDVTSLYRDRAHVLGDIVHGGANYVKEAKKSYKDSGYTAHLSNTLNRTPMIYAPANDGMLHAFNATTGVEVWAFVPQSVIPNLYQLGRKDYDNAYQYSVDGVPTIAEMYIGSTWKTVLIGGLRGGGAEYFALDITDPANPSPLWSFRDSKLGKTYGFPVVGKIGGVWKVLLTSGYDTPDNLGYVFVVDAATGTLNKTIATACTATDGTCNLSKIGALYNEKDVDDTFKMAYAGDLGGNLWRFNVTDSSVDAVKVAQTGIAGTRLPISSAPMVREMAKYKNASNNSMHVLTFGTGKYLQLADFADGAVQSFYSLLVDPDNTSMDSDFTNLGSSSKIMPLVIDKTCDGTLKAALTAGTATMIAGITYNGLSTDCPITGDFANSDGNFDTITLKRAAGTTLAASATCQTDIKGWRANLPISMERVSNDPFDYGDVALFASVVPASDACTAGGDGRDYRLPATLSKNWLCQKSTVTQYLTIGKNVDRGFSDDPGHRVTITTPTVDSQVIDNDPTLGATLSDEQSRIKPPAGFRSSWTELLR